MIEIPQSLLQACFYFAWQEIYHSFCNLNPPTITYK